jgi:hypothetical protein
MPILQRFLAFPFGIPKIRRLALHEKHWIVIQVTYGLGNRFAANNVIA